MASIQRRGRLCREEILSAAAASFYEHGYAETTLGHVARQLAVTDKAIYYYFSSKDALYLETLANAMKRISSMTGTIDASDLSGLGKFKAFTRAILRETTDLRLLLRGLPDHLEETEAGQRIRATERANEEIFVGWVSEGIEDGSIRPGDPRMLWRWNQGAIIWLDVWSRREREPSGSRLENEVMAMLDRSLAGMPDRTKAF